ncbi:MAG: hypothetical protein GXP32_01640 [Kiritimatiellaeota bacterium]|nr:hypothetical protein [Kiritimatiellota bacterium]
MTSQIFTLAHFRSKHLTRNIVHKERFFCESSEYDKKNSFNEVLLAGLRATAAFAEDGSIRSRAINLSFHFSDWERRNFDPVFFERLTYDRKTKGYEKAIDLAKLILLRLNPQIKSGKHNVSAIFFDMNQLWEEWLLSLYRSTYRDNDSVCVLGNQRKWFWESLGDGSRVYSEPDIVVKVGAGRIVVLDAKWKIPSDKPHEHDMRQMFAYNLLWGGKDAWLIYPAVGGAKHKEGVFKYEPAGKLGLLPVDIFDAEGALVDFLELPEFLIGTEVG